jgi:hypothetical protein
MTTRKDRLKNLMKDRTTVEQGFTLKQMFSEIYPEVAEKYIGKTYDTGQSMYDMYNSMYWEEFGKFRYLKRLIKDLKKIDEFRWLSIMPVKRNEVDRYGRKVRPYLEYRYININATKTPELLEEVNKIWLKHAEACLKGHEDKRARLDRIAAMPEGQVRQSAEQLVGWMEYEVLVAEVLEDKSINKMIEELKTEDKLPKLYVYDHKRMEKIFNIELLNSTQRYNPALPKKKELRQIIKDTIVCYCNKKDYEFKKEYDWNSLTYATVKS